MFRCYTKFKKSLQHHLVDILQNGKLYLSMRINGIDRDNWMLFADIKGRDGGRCTYLSSRVPPQWVNGKMDAKVELQTLGLSICIFDLSGYVVCPQLKEHFVVSIIKRAKEVFLQRSKSKNVKEWWAVRKELLEIPFPS